MIFIENALQKIGKECLIVKLKANNFFQGDSLRKEDFSQLFEILNFGKNINLSQSIKNNLLLCVLYYEYDDNEEAQKKLEELLIDYKKLLSGGTKEDELHILFNIVEIEIKIQKKTDKELKVLFNEIQSFISRKNNFDDYLLMKHYFGYIKFLLKSYTETDNYTTDIISDIDEHGDLSDNNLVKYIRIRNVLLKIKAFEASDPEKNYKEIISHLDCIFSLTKNIKEDFAICVGIKMLYLQSKEITSYEVCINLIQEMLNILKRETLFGKTHKNILEQYLYLSGLLGYYNAINDDFDGMSKMSKKIDKYLGNVNNIIQNMSKSEDVDNKRTIKLYDGLYQQYQMYNTLLKTSININNSSINDSKIAPKELKKFNSQNEVDLLNLYILEQDNIKMNPKFKNMEEEFNNWIKKGGYLKNDKILLGYFYLYNQLSDLTKQIVLELDKTKKLEQIEKIQKFVKTIIQNTSNQVTKNDYLKQIFMLPYFKNLINRLFYVQVYSYFVVGNYKEALNQINDYDIAEKQYELKTPKSTAYMERIKGDCYFKLQKYTKAIDIYNNILINGSNDPLVHFNLGMSYFYDGQKFKALIEFETANSIYKSEKNNKKCKIIENILSKLNKD